MSLSDTLEPIGDSILEWADSEKQFRGYTEGWFLTDFTSAATVASVYVGFVIIGSAVMKYSGLPAMDPYPLKFIYNVSQIMLCAYMTIEAFLLAYRNGYTVLPCNDYDTTNPPLPTSSGCSTFPRYVIYYAPAWLCFAIITVIVGKS